MTINEIKDLTKFLNEEDVEKIKEEIKSKEQILKEGDLDNEEIIKVLNALFAILVIEKTLESEIEGVEMIRDELELELIEAYNLYDSYMVNQKKEDKKKKKRWLLDFLFMSDNIRSKKENINASNKRIKMMESELNTLRSQKSDDNLRNVVNKNDGRESFEKFCDYPLDCLNPRHHNNIYLKEKMSQRNAKIYRDIMDRRKGLVIEQRPVFKAEPQERIEIEIKVEKSKRLKSSGEAGVRDIKTRTNAVGR